MDARFVALPGPLLLEHHLTIATVIFLRIWFAKYPDDEKYFIGYGLLSVASVLFNVLISA